MSFLGGKNEHHRMKIFSLISLLLIFVLLLLLRFSEFVDEKIDALHVGQLADRCSH